jgi:hypothetical protein
MPRRRSGIERSRTAARRISLFANWLPIVSQHRQ